MLRKLQHPDPALTTKCLEAMLNPSLAVPAGEENYSNTIMDIRYLFTPESEPQASLSAEKDSTTTSGTSADTDESGTMGDISSNGSEGSSLQSPTDTEDAEVALYVDRGVTVTVTRDVDGSTSIFPDNEAKTTVVIDKQGRVKVYPLDTNGD